MEAGAVFDAWLGGLHRVVAWPEFGLLLVGVLIGALVGILPGVGGPATLALLLPLVLTLNPMPAIALLIGVAAVTATTGDLTSILLGVPGEATAAAAVIDGHPMALRGEAARAIGASLLASLAGSVFGALALVLTIPAAAVLARSLGSPELFMLAILGIAFIPAASSSSRAKGLVAGGLGLLLATVGLDPMGASPRFTFGQLSLWEGIGPIPLVLGLFAIPEIVQLASANRSSLSRPAAATGRLSDGFRDVMRGPALVLRSCGIGTAVGLIPGIGATISQWLAYADAARRSPQHAEFGRGAVQGVIAPSAATTATLGGALVPTLAFGVPGSLTSAILFSALVMKGVVPGPNMVVPESQGGHLTLVFALAWFMVTANLVAVLLSCVSTRLLVRITEVRATRLVPFMLLLTFIGAFTERHSLADLIVTCILGAFGLALLRYEWPRAPVLMGLVLGPLAENRLFLSMDAYGTAWLLRPGVLIIGAITLAGVLLPSSRRWSRALSEGPTPPAPVTTSHSDEPWFAALLLILLVGAYVAADFYPPRARFLPHLISAVTIACLVATFARETRAHRWSFRFPIWGGASVASPIIRWIPIFLLLIWSLGFLAGAPLAVLAYVVIVGGEGPLQAAALFGGAYALVYVVMFRLLGVPFPSGALFGWIGPAGF